MNNQEKLIPWQPLERLSKKVHIDSVCNDSKGFRVVLIESDRTDRKILLDFCGAVRAYRETDDLIGDRLLRGAIAEYSSHTSNPWSLFKVINSDYLQWAAYNSGISDLSAINIEHYVIFTEDWIIEILSWIEPDVKLIILE